MFFFPDQSKKTKPNQSRDYCQMFLISEKKARILGKKTIPKGMNLKIYRNL